MSWKETRPLGSDVDKRQIAQVAQEIACLLMGIERLAVRGLGMRFVVGIPKLICAAMVGRVIGLGASRISERPPRWRSSVPE